MSHKYYILRKNEFISTIVVDSPKLPQKHTPGHLKRGKSLNTTNQSSRKNSAFIPKRQMSTSGKPASHTIVVVKPAINSDATEKDPDLIRLLVLLLLFYFTLKFYTLYCTLHIYAVKF